VVEALATLCFILVIVLILIIILVILVVVIIIVGGNDGRLVGVLVGVAEVADAPVCM
jgi:hypothetical protein